MPDVTTAHFDCPNPAATAALARRLGRRLGAGDTLLLSGPLGAGKSAFARALIQDRLAAIGRHEEVPSPTYTLVQVYQLDGVDVWHADLYRIADPGEIAELGLPEAFDTAICLVEWPEVMGAEAPAAALMVRFDPGAGPEDRRLTLSGPAARWGERIAGLGVQDV